MAAITAASLIKKLSRLPGDTKVVFYPGTTTYAGLEFFAKGEKQDIATGPEFDGKNIVIIILKDIEG